jgi:proton-translocating NAD(P)+ transhydrogenase subunit alpha
MTVTVGVLRETATGERRVALTPDVAGRLTRQGIAVMVETGAGQGAWFGDARYASASATVASRDDVYAGSDVIACVHPPDDVASLHEGQVLLGMLTPLADAERCGRYADAKVTALSLDLLPRTLSRAQAMDALTSQANVAGYKAALVAADAYGAYFPMLMTAAGTTRPAQVLVLGAGVAGLQAIATARRLGALVTGYDVREAARADVASTGAAVLDLSEASGTGDGGYARQLTDAEAHAQRKGLDAAIPRFDVVITTAQVPGGRPPLLVSSEALAALRPGSVVVDLAAGEGGGNVAGSVPDATTVTARGVTVIGAGNLPAAVPQAASTAYSRNVAAMLACVVRDGELAIDLDDEVQAGVVVTHDGLVIHPQVCEAMNLGKEARP